MRLCTYDRAGQPRAAVVNAAEHLVDIADALAGAPTDLAALVANWAHWRPAIAGLASGEDRSGPAAASAPLLAPLPRPVRDIFCVGKNYDAHAREFHRSGFDSSGGAEALPQYPVIFTKATTSVSGPGAPIPAYKDPTATVDYEGELAVVIGTGGSGIAAANAFDHVFGYMVLNDVTSRDLQKRHQQWVIGKGIDGFCPCGPWLVTRDAVPDVRALRVTTDVNGERRQDAPVADLIFDIPTLIETLSASITLLPGDIIATGTPVGVGIGFTPPRYLKPGDVVRVEITGLGALENPVVGAP